MSILPEPLADAFHTAFARLDAASKIEPHDFVPLYAPLGETLTWLMAADEVLHGKWWRGRQPPFEDGERLRLGLRWARNETLHGLPVARHFAGRSVRVIGGMPGRMVPGTLSAVPGYASSWWVFAERGPLDEHYQGGAYASDVAGKPLLPTIERAWHVVTGGE